MKKRKLNSTNPKYSKEEGVNDKSQDRIERRLIVKTKKIQAFAVFKT